jgi:CRP-like cAMP-binding protein
MLSPVEKLLFLKKVPMFAQVRDEYLTTLAGRLEEISLAEDEALFRENDIGDSMYIVVSGAVRVEKGERVLATLGPGECVGEMAVLDAEPRSATVVAAQDCLLLMIGEHELFDIMAGQIEIARGLFKVITGRLREARGEAAEARAPDPEGS